MLLALACAKESPMTTASASNEKTYPMTATIVSRDPANNTVNLDNKEVPGRMAAMKMDYEVRGAKVSLLPPDGSAVEVTMHDRDGAYYVTDVKVKK
jgi:copper binding protein CusF